MVETAENVAKEFGITKEECDAVVLRRFEQYQAALANDRAFQKRYMFAPEVTVTRKKTKLMEQDEGWTPTTAEGLARLKPVRPGGVLSFGAQTFPADGNCGIIVTTKEKARALSADPKIEIQIVSYGYCAGQTDVHARGTDPGRRDGPRQSRPEGYGREGRQDPQPLCRQ